VAHSLVETYSVLTRLPAPFRAPADVVATFLARRFPDDPLVLPAGDLVGLLERLATVGVHGGAVHDAVIGATAGSADCVLVTLDRRAARTYRLVGCSFELLCDRRRCDRARARLTRVRCVPTRGPQR